jgi:hypothetical protein
MAKPDPEVHSAENEAPDGAVLPPTNTGIDQPELFSGQRFKVEVATVWTDDGEKEVTEETADREGATFRLLPVGSYGRLPRTDEVLAPLSAVIEPEIEVIDDGQTLGLHIGIPLDKARKLLGYLRGGGWPDDDMDVVINELASFIKAAEEDDDAPKPETATAPPAPAIAEGQAWRSKVTKVMYTVTGFLDGAVQLTDADGSEVKGVSEETLRGYFTFEGTKPS